MTDLSQMLRWNTSFVRGLAESVLERAKVIRQTLDKSIARQQPSVATKSKAKKSMTVKKAAKSVAKANLGSKGRGQRKTKRK